MLAALKIVRSLPSDAQLSKLCNAGSIPGWFWQKRATLGFSVPS